MDDITFLPAAAQDYDDAYAWYAERGEAVATRFEAGIEHALTQIAAAPQRWPHCDRRHRRFVVRRLPYSIIYRVDGTSIVVVAVAHTRRRPRYWQSRH